MSIPSDKDLLNDIIATKFKDADKKLVPTDLTYEDISKVGFEKYIGHDRGSIRIFFFSAGSSRNNKPYKLDGRTIEEYTELVDRLEICRADTEDLFSTGSKPTTDPFTSGEEPKKEDYMPFGRPTNT